MPLEGVPSNLSKDKVAGKEARKGMAIWRSISITLLSIWGFI